MSPSIPVVLRIAALAGTAIGSAATHANAQSMDYGALQQLFGEPVTTSATGTPLRARDVPANMEIVTADDIRRSGAYDIPGVLQHVLGVDVLRWSVLGADVSIRGYDSPMAARLLVLIDGRQVYLDDFGRTDWASLPVELSEIRQIEVVKGPNSALFGFNAAGGVINIITFNPLYDRINTAAMTLGTQGYRELSAVAADRIDENVGIKLSAGGTWTDDYAAVRNLVGEQGLQSNGWRNQFSADMHWRLDTQSELELQATHSEDQHVALLGQWVPSLTHIQLNSLLARYTAETSIGVITGTAYSNWADATAPFNFGSATHLSFPTQLTVTQLQDQFQLGSTHTIRLTAEYRHNGIDSIPTPGGFVSYDIGSVGAMWNWQVTPDVTLTAAGRGDLLSLGRSGGGLEQTTLSNSDWSRQSLEPSYNLGAVWHVREDDHLRLEVARGLQLPSLIALGGVQNLPVESLQVNSNPAIRPTVVNNYEADWDHDFPDVAMQSKIAVFYQTTSDVQSLTSPYTITPTSNGSLLIFSGNIGNSREVGAEFSLGGTLAKVWRWSIGYSPRAVWDDAGISSSTNTTGIDFTHTTPRHVVKASLGWSRDAWEIDSFLNVQSSAAGLFLNPQTGFSLAPIGTAVSFDTRVAYKVTSNLTLSLNGENILFSSARQNGWSKNQQQVLGQAVVHF